MRLQPRQKAQGLRIAVKLRELQMECLRDRLCLLQDLAVRSGLAEDPVLAIDEPTANGRLALMAERRIAQVVPEPRRQQDRLDNVEQGIKADAAALEFARARQIDAHPDGAREVGDLV
jgi:hypothetical protein